MQFKSKCECGNNKFLVFTEKMYEGYISESGVLVCEPAEQHIDEVKCSSCGKRYSVNDFKEVNY